MKEQEVLIQVADQEVACCKHPSAPLLWPAEWTDELEAHGFLDAAVSLLSYLPAEATAVPWIIGSASKSIFGMPRQDSLSHMEGRAFDMSPMYSETVAIQPGSPIMGLAWNIVYLAIFAAAQTGKIPFVVEGDHLHVEPGASGEGLEPGSVFAVFTAPTWYTWTNRVLTTPIGRALLPSIWCFNGMRCEIESPSPELATRLKKYLTPSATGEEA